MTRQGYGMLATLFETTRRLRYKRRLRHQQRVIEALPPHLRRDIGWSAGDAPIHGGGRSPILT